MAAREQQIQQLVAQTGIRVGGAQILHDEHEEPVPALEQLLPASHLHRRERRLGRRRGRVRGRQVERDTHLDPLVVHLDAEGMKRRQGLQHGARPRRVHRRPDEALRFLDRRREVEREARELALEAALHHVPQPARHDGAPPGRVVEVRVEAVQAELPAIAHLRSRHRLEVALPRQRGEAEAEKGKAEAGRGLRGHAHPTGRRPDAQIA